MQAASSFGLPHYNSMTTYRKINIYTERQTYHFSLLNTTPTINRLKSRGYYMYHKLEYWQPLRSALPVCMLFVSISEYTATVSL